VEPGGLDRVVQSNPRQVVLAPPSCVRHPLDHRIPLPTRITDPSLTRPGAAGKGWRLRTVWEAQLFPITDDGIRTCTARYRAKGIQVCWISPHEQPPNWIDVVPVPR
jgi:hypothetical protein